MKKILTIALLSLYTCAHAQNCDSIIRHYQAIRTRDSLIIKDRNFRLNWINHYISIIRHNPSQLKFAVSWISRQDVLPPDTVFRSNPVDKKADKKPVKKLKKK